MVKFIQTIFIVLLAAYVLLAEVKTDTISYNDGDVTLEGSVTYDQLLKSRRGGVLLIHDRQGHDTFIHKRAEALADLGYVVFALDMYGKGVSAKNADEAEDLVEPFFGEDRQLMRQRAQAGYEVLASQKRVDPARIVVVGYGFGGTAALELARSGLNLLGVVDFYGDLSTPTPEDAQNIKGAVLLLFGADDPNVSTEKLDQFKEEMRLGRVDWQIYYYGGTVAGFADYALGFEINEGRAYNYNADKRSWEAVKSLLLEKLK